jgi:hypothetical protein
MKVLLYKLQTLKAVDAKINGAFKRHVLDDADLKVRTKYMSTRNAKQEMNFFFNFFYCRKKNQNSPFQHFHGEDSRNAVIFLINNWTYFSCCSKRASIFLYVMSV